TVHKKTHHLQSHRGKFEEIVQEATTSMPPYRQRFSALIHRKTVSNLSDFVGKTIARPNPILFGAVASFFATVTLYLLSKNLGYSLSGFESIGAFAVGWTAGIIFDLVSHLLKRK